jgi:peptidoglycan/LPS O-acetylase OafA/YrhL
MIESRLQGADFLRAAACLLVLLHHLIQRLSPYAIESGVRPLFQFGLMGSFGVSAFFVLSGFLLSRPFWVAYDAGEPMPSVRTYALRRAARILPGYWLALTVTFVLSVTLFPLTLDQSLVTRFVAGALLINDFHYTTLFPVEYNGPLWSIGFEATSYVLLPLCLALVFLARPWARTGWVARGLWLLVIGAALGAHVLIQLWPVSNDMRGWNYGLVGGAKEWMPRFNPIGFFAIFAIGALAAAVQVRWAALKNWTFDLLALAGLAGAAWSMAGYVEGGIGEGWGLFNVPYGFPTFPLSIALTLAAAPSSRIAGWLLDNPAARYIARISFGIYVWHFLVIEVVRQNWYPRFFHGGTEMFGEWLMVSAAVTGITVLIAHVSYNVLEAPVIAWARGLEKRQPAAAPAAAA